MSSWQWHNRLFYWLFYHNSGVNLNTQGVNTPLRGHAFKARISVWVCIRTINAQRGCMLTPYTTEVSLEIRFLSLHTEWGSHWVTVLALHIHSSLCQKSSVCKCVSSVWWWSKHMRTKELYQYTHNDRIDVLVNSRSYALYSFFHLLVQTWYHGTAMQCMRTDVISKPRGKQSIDIYTNNLYTALLSLAHIPGRLIFYRNPVRYYSIIFRA